jgi:hypothetical protein
MFLWSMSIPRHPQAGDFLIYILYGFIIFLTLDR